MKYILLIILQLTIISGFSQDYLEKIAIQSCACLDEVSDTLNPEQIAMELGLCMINASMPYQKQLKKDYGIDLNKIDVQGEELGKIIGIKMISICPNKLVSMAKIVDEVKETKSANPSFTGIVTNYEDELFVVFSINDDIGKSVKFYWFTFIKTEMDLINNYKTLIGKRINLTYISDELFDPRINEYRTCNIILSMDLLPE